MKFHWGPPKNNEKQSKTADDQENAPQNYTFKYHFWMGRQWNLNIKITTIFILKPSPTI